jgi:hypothetical protein
VQRTDKLGQTNAPTDTVTHSRKLQNGNPHNGLESVNPRFHDYSPNAPPTSLVPKHDHQQSQAQHSFNQGIRQECRTGSSRGRGTDGRLTLGVGGVEQTGVLLRAEDCWVEFINSIFCNS